MKPPIIAIRPQIVAWEKKKKEIEDLEEKSRVRKQIAENRSTYMHFLRQIKKAQRASGVDNQDFIPWLKFVVEIMEAEVKG